MAQSNYTDQQVDDYIMERLSKVEMDLFQKELAIDNELAPRVEARRILIKGIEEYHSLELKNKLKTIHKKTFEERKENSTPVAKKRKLGTWLTIAASIALLVGALFWLNQSPTNPKDIYVSNFEPYQLNLSQRNSGDEQLLRLESLYNNGQYQESVPLFESALKEEANSSQLLLGIGISKLELHQNKAALEHFDAIIANGDLLFKDHALWYAGLAALKMNDVEMAKKYLNDLVKNPGADHLEAAKVILNDLE